ncbi:MAG: peptidase inhibitor I78 [Sphingobium sp. 32-64-5]|nr:MAG: peptidase inhibitor I78 [Sphingobium sp. 32-64-5]
MRFPALMMGCASLFAAGGCAATSTDADGPATPPAMEGQPAMEGACSNDALQQFIGQKATAELGARMLQVSGARTLRWGGPNMAMTMDFRPDRLTVSYDYDMIIERASCG